MSYEPRTIAYLAEIVYQPIQLRSDVAQGIHNTLFRRPEISYQNFQVAQDGIHLTNLPDSPGAVSSVTLLPDRLVLREELRSTTVEEFATRLVNVSTIALRALNVQQSLAQQFVVRSLVTPAQFANSTEFLARRVIHAGEGAWADFGRPVQSIGLRLLFPQTPEHPQVYNLRIETWNQDPRSLWIENIGSFARPLPVENLPDLSTHLYSTYQFLTGKALPFVAQFEQL